MNLEQQNNGPVDLILIDYCMPDMTGYDLLREVKVNLLFLAIYNFSQTLMSYDFSLIFILMPLCILKHK